MIDMRRIGVTVIGGFLGAGKTTLLNQWLRSPNANRVTVLVNDFGVLNIDAELITAQHGDTIALTNGCICCQIGGDLTQALIRVLNSMQMPEELWIEASGVADPGRIARLVRAVGEFELRGVIVVVDILAIIAQLQDPLLRDTVLAQILSADYLLLRKTDLADTAQLAAVRACLYECYPDALLLDADPSGLLAKQLNDMRIFATLPKPWRPQPEHERRFSAWLGHPALTLPVPEWLRRLRSLPEPVLRLKGFVRSLEHGWSHVQLANAQIEITPCAEPLTANASLVAIALRGSLPIEALNGILLA